MAKKMKKSEKFPSGVNLEQCVILIGNPLDGFVVVGPFDTSGDAHNYAEQVMESSEEYWVTRTHQVKCDEVGLWAGSPYSRNEEIEIEFGVRKRNS